MASIWIDLDNAPHVPFFTPLISTLNENGHNVLVTVRDYGYTHNLIEQQGIPHTLIGRHSGKNPFLKVAGLSSRVLSLALWASGRKIDVAVSHGSRALVLASSLLRIPCVTMYDYEFVSTGIFNRLSSLVLLPDALPDELLASLHLSPDRICKYPGLKEEVYLGNFTPDRSVLDTLEVQQDEILIALRPPATAAHYHNPDSERIFQAVLDRISADPQAVGIVLPRTAEQAEVVRKSLKNPLNFRILSRPVHGLNLIWHCDLVVGGGGTMNRESALLGVPVYSLFMGKIGAIDRMLSEQGRLIMMRREEDVTRIKFEKREKPDLREQMDVWKARSTQLVEFISGEILKMVR